MNGKVTRRPPRRALAIGTIVAAVVSWTVAVVIIVFFPHDADSVIREIFQMAVTIGAVTTGVPLLVSLLGDRLRTIADAYLIGYANGCEDTLRGDAAEDQRRLRIVD